jgi:predicted nuclease of predicted toxin-antitoxin system
MKRILLDENIPIGLVRLLDHGGVQHITQLGWDGISNGRLLAAAQQVGFEVLVTADRNMRHQQNMPTLALAVVVLSTNKWRIIQSDVSRISAAIEQARSGTVTELRLVGR